MTLQDLFNNALWGVIQQGALASNPDSEDGEMRCRYRMEHSDGSMLACGIGQSLPADLDPTEGQSASEVLFYYKHSGEIACEFNTHKTAVIELPNDDDGGGDGAQGKIVDHLQRCHDRAANLNQFRDNMRAFARQAGLLYDETCPEGWVAPFRRA